ncbi:defense against restriction DarA-related protein [Psychrobacter sp. AOP31-E1-50]|uniref:defense against restriction DarA-related protein n=1 Tax=Psychrobacter sp. AOP31-E1-50 TaxID=3457692 RepID=UPI004035484C
MAYITLNKAHTHHKTTINGQPTSQYSRYETGLITGNKRDLPAILADSTGSDGYSFDSAVGSADDSWHVLNAFDKQGLYVDSIAVGGAMDADHATVVARTQLDSLGAANLKVIGEGLVQFDSINQSNAGTFSVDAINKLMDNPSQDKNYLPIITASELAYEADRVTFDSVEWADNSNELLSHDGRDSTLMLDMTRADTRNDLVNEFELADVLDLLGAEPEQSFDALMDTKNRLGLLKDRLYNAMSRAGNDTVSVTNVTETKPFKRQGVTNIAFVFDLSDGQKLSIWFHNPDSTPSKLMPSDIMISWKWMLNKRDVTAALSPKQGDNVQLPALASRIMRVAAKNSMPFKRTQAKRLKLDNELAEAKMTIENKTATIEQLDQDIASLNSQIDAAMKAPKVELVVEPVVEPVIKTSVVDETVAEPAGQDSTTQDDTDVAAPITITGKEIDVSEDVDFKTAKNNAMAYFDNNLKDKVVFCPAIDSDVLLRRRGGKHIAKANHTFREKLKLVAAIPEMIKQGKYGHYTALNKEKGSNIEGYYVLNVAVVVGGNLKAARVVLEKNNEGEVLYDIGIDKKEALAALGDTITKNTFDGFTGSSQYQDFLDESYQADDSDVNQFDNVLETAIPDNYSGVASSTVNIKAPNSEDVNQDQTMFDKADLATVDGVLNMFILNETSIEDTANHDTDNELADTNPNENTSTYVADSFSELSYISVTKTDDNQYEASIKSINNDSKLSGSLTEIKGFISNYLEGLGADMSVLSLTNGADVLKTDTDPDHTPTNPNNKKITKGKSNKAKTPKGTKIESVFALVDAKFLIASHTANGSKNPKYPQELQPRDRARESSIAWVQKTSRELDPESLGRTGRVDTGAPIVGDDLVVESGNGRTIAIKMAYANGDASEYREWLAENADMFGMTAKQVESYKQPILVRMRTTQVNRSEFAVEANQDDKLSFTASERAKSDAKRVNAGMLELFDPSESGDILAASNRPFVKSFLASLGATEAAQYTDSNGNPTQALVARIKGALFSKAYDDDRLLEMMADQTKPELQNTLNALTMAAPKFVAAQAVNRSDAQDLAEKVVDSVEQSLSDEVKNAIVDATNMIMNAKLSNQDIKEYVLQQGLFEQVDDATAELAVFLAANARSAKKMTDYFNAMASYIEQDSVSRQTLDMFGEPEPLSLADVIAHANNQVNDNTDTIGTLDMFNETVVEEAVVTDNQATTSDKNYSSSNPYAAYANDDEDAMNNADQWEAREPLTENRLDQLNKMAESLGFSTFIESRHAGLGVFQAAKEVSNRKVEIDGKFKNNDGQSSKEAPRDFTIEKSENGNIVDYQYTNDLSDYIKKANDWLNQASPLDDFNTANLAAKVDGIVNEINSSDFDPEIFDVDALSAIAEEAEGNSELTAKLEAASEVYQNKLMTIAMQAMSDMAGN